MGELSVAIVGLGSRGLSVFERVVSRARKAGEQAGRVRVELVDPTCAGTGLHTTDQPDYLLLNTTCSQVSMFPDASTVGDEVDEPGPSLYAWVAARGLKLAEDGYTVGSSGRAIRPTDFLPRRVLGEYLEWFLGYVRERVPAHVQVNMRRSAAIDVSSEPDDRLVLTLADGTSIRVQYLFLTTGHTPNDSIRPGRPGAGRSIDEPYPLPGRVAKIKPTQVVAISGFGLSAMDLISALTVGRGGRYVDEAGLLRYVPNGEEPTLLLYSRSGVPYRARPLVNRFDRKYRPLILTRAGIDAVRAARNGPLDFDHDLLPLVLTEMRVAYRRCQASLAGTEAEQALARDLATGEVLPVLDALDARLGAFDPFTAWDGSSGMLLDNSAAYQRWLADVVRRDLSEGLLGPARSPVKAALDIIRELRDTIRYAVDFGGLTAASQDEFTQRTVPLMNRAVVGPQHERHAELLALMAVGILHAPFGPAPEIAWNDRAGRWTITSTALGEPFARHADWLCSAHTPSPTIASSMSPLIRSLHLKGWIRRHRPDSRLVHGIEVDPDQHPVDAQGHSERRLWVLGPLCEGVTFYNHLVPSPQTYSRPIADAHRCVAAMFTAGRPTSS